MNYCHGWLLGVQLPGTGNRNKIMLNQSGQLGTKNYG